jgi:hypothetical protein
MIILETGIDESRMAHSILKSQFNGSDTAILANYKSDRYTILTATNALDHRDQEQAR